MAEPNFSENAYESTPLPLRANGSGRINKGALRQWAQDCLKGREYSVACVLIDHADQHAICTVRIRTIAEKLEISRRTVERTLARLEHRGAVKITRRQARSGAKISNSYRLTMRQGVAWYASG